MVGDMTHPDPEQLERERLAADQRYNEALTALDHAVVAAAQLPALGRDDLGRLGTALIVFLQQITAFVDTKDRQLAAEAAGRADAIAPAADAIGELRTQVSLLQRAIDMLKREVVSRQSPVIGPQSPVASPASAGVWHGDDYKYVGFEDAFRGSDQVIEERLRAYVPLFTGRTNVLDVGCGRGELLSALRAAGVAARGIDANSEMVAVARERGFDAQRADALSHVTSLPDASLGGVIATQVIEHLEPSYLMQLIEAASHKLQPGAPIVLETINPACWLAFFSSYLRDLTHVRPIHPDTLQYLLRASGFERVSIRYSAPVPEQVRMKTIDLPADVLATSESSARALVQVAHVLNANAAILNNLMFTHLDYAAIGYRA
jgi:SAM-dependent methyltransferase